MSTGDTQNVQCHSFNMSNNGVDNQLDKQLEIITLIANKVKLIEKQINVMQQDYAATHNRN